MVVLMAMIVFRGMFVVLAVIAMFYATGHKETQR